MLFNLNDEIKCLPFLLIPFVEMYIVTNPNFVIIWAYNSLIQAVTSSICASSTLT